MPRTSDRFTISLPPAMNAEVERVMAQENRTRSELIREALRVYFATGKAICQNHPGQDAQTEPPLLLH